MHPFLKCINDNFLIQHVEDNTRGKNILDLVFTSEENMIENLRVGELFGTSDHQIIRWSMVACKVIQNSIKNYQYNKVDYDIMRNESKLLNWTEIVNGKNVENDWSKFKLVLDNMRDKFVPYRIAKNRRSKWITREVTKCRRAKVKAWKKYRESGHALDAYKKYIE